MDHGQLSPYRRCESEVQIAIDAPEEGKEERKKAGYPSNMESGIVGRKLGTT